MLKSCHNCIYAVRADSTCARLQTSVDLQRDVCPFYASVPHVCSICHRTGRVEDLLIDAKTNQLICAECLAAASTCKLCAHNSSCDFETNPSPLPKVIVQNIRQGNMTMQTQIRNPERVKITCAAGCKCYINGDCARQVHSCGNHKCILDKE